MSLKKEKWGPHTWIFLHSLASAATTPEKRYEFRKIIYSLAAGGLPCDECTDHFRTIVYSNSNSNDKNKDLDKYNIDKYLDSNNSLFKWTWLVHNLVNRRLDKPRIKLSEARAFYFGSDAVCTDSCNANANASPSSTSSPPISSIPSPKTNSNTSKISTEINQKIPQNSKPLSISKTSLSKNNSVSNNSSHFSPNISEHDIHPSNPIINFNRPTSTFSPSRSLPYSNSNQTRFSLPLNNSNHYPINSSNILHPVSNITPNYTNFNNISSKNNSLSHNFPSHSNNSNNFISTSNLSSNHNISIPSHTQSRRSNFVPSSLSSYPIKHHPYNPNDYVVLDFSG